jgi:nuclear RNA export factor
MDVYHPACTFSYSANTAIPVRAKIQGHHTSLPNQRKMQWTDWLGGSRNLMRIGRILDKQVTTLHVGAENTVKALVTLPGTRHQVQGNAERFCLDAWPVSTSGGTNLFITVHGEFVEGERFCAWETERALFSDDFEVCSSCGGDTVV